MSKNLRKLRRRYIVLWRRDVTDELHHALSKGRAAEAAALARSLPGRGTGPRKRNYRRAVVARPCAADLQH
eukprot:6417519-Pyramimonas_sp.AAC.3